MEATTRAILVEGRVRSMVNWKETKCGKCKIQRGRPVCNSCFSYDKFIPIAITNADRIRSFSDEELADYIFGVSVHEKPCVLCSDDCDFCELTDEECKNRTLKWLQSEVE